MYEKCFKRILDFMVSLVAVLILSPILLILTVAGTIAMGGNPFFTQERPGKNEKIFRLIKFRTMNNKKDKNGKLLPDEKRLTSYGRWLRSTSMDELPELFNILIGDMSFVGPRPLLVKYLPRYNKEQRRRHCTRPGLTGLAQVNGRNNLTWEDKFKYDVKYVDNVSFIGDLKILIETVKIVLQRSGISSETSETMEEFMGTSETVK